MPTPNFFKTDYTGIVYTEGVTSDGKPDKTYYSRFRKDGRQFFEKEGKASRGMTPKKAFTSRVLKEQGKKLMVMIGTAVNSLTNIEAVVPAIRDMAIRHVDYGVKPEDYDSVGTALLWTLEQGLGDDFTPDVKEAWTEVYGLVAGTMKDAAYS